VKNSQKSQSLYRQEIKQAGTIRCFGSFKEWWV